MPDSPVLPPVKKIPYGVSGKEAQARKEKNLANFKKDMLSGKYEKVFAKEDQKYSPQVNATVKDVEGMSFEQIGKELGLSVSGAKRATREAIKKIRWATNLAWNAPEILDNIILVSLGKYIDYLASSDEVSDEEIKLLKDNPEIVEELDGFREFLEKEIKDFRKDNDLDLDDDEELDEARKLYKEKNRKIIQKEGFTIILEKKQKV